MMSSATSKKTKRQRVLLALREHGPATGAELGIIMADDRYAAHRELPELERRGLAKRAGFRKCKITRRQCQIWQAVRVEANVFNGQTHNLDFGS